MTTAAVIGSSGQPVGTVETDRRAGACYYYWHTTTDGTPVNVQRGRLSRAARYMRPAILADDETDREGLPPVRVCRD
jgi:hypothetical protein